VHGWPNKPCGASTSSMTPAKRPFCSTTPSRCVVLRGGRDPHFEPHPFALERRDLEPSPHRRVERTNRGLDFCAKHVKRAGRGFTSFIYRVRVLLHAGGVTWPARSSPRGNRHRLPIETGRAGNRPSALKPSTSCATGLLSFLICMIDLPERTGVEIPELDYPSWQPFRGAPPACLVAHT
jgi:hypothetical protein